MRACVRRTLAQLALQPLLSGAFLLRTLLLLAPCLAHVAQDDPVAVLAIPGLGINVRGGGVQGRLWTHVYMRAARVASMDAYACCL